jgi:mannitol/fructose-specific phosphotransferase system IIA component (Ntr-type)
MGRPLQIREVPDEVLAALKEKAEAEHLSLAAYALRILEREAQMPTVAEILRVPGSRAKVTKEEIVALVRKDREAH